LLFGAGFWQAGISALVSNSTTGEAALIPAHFHSASMADQALKELIDKNCAGYEKINMPAPPAHGVPGR